MVLRAAAWAGFWGCFVAALSSHADELHVPRRPSGQEAELPPDVAPPDPATVESAITTLVQRADSARKASQFKEAETAYRAALKIRNDATIIGRLGLTQVAAGQPARAARNLQEAIERGGGETPAETDEFFRAYQRIRPYICLLYVKGNITNATISIDGGPFYEENGSTFKIYVAPGKHIVRGKSDERGEAHAERECPKGADATVVLSWYWPLGVPDKPEILRRHKAERVQNLEEPPKDEPPRREPIVGGVLGQERPQGLRATLAAGPVVVFGVASWSPAVGGVLAGSLRPNEYVSIGLEARGAWLTSGVSGFQISAMTAGGLLSACGHYRWFFGCALGHLGVINVKFAGTSYRERSIALFNPGGGARIGTKLALGRSFSVQAAVDALLLASGTKLVVGQTILADQPPVMITSHVLGGWEF